MERTRAYHAPQRAERPHIAWKEEGLSTRRRVAASRALELACLVLVLAGAVALSPGLAAGDEAKHPIPAIAKLVSAGAAGWAEEASADAGSTVRYRLAMTMSETVAKDERAEYLVLDTPDDAVEVDASSLQACIVGTNGAVKAPIDAKVSFQGRTMAIDLGDLKAACPGLGFGDIALIGYEARVSGSAHPGAYQNVAKLVYDLGDGPAQTVGVRTIVKVPGSRAAVGGIPKTGDMLPPWLAVVPAILAIVAALLVATASRPVPVRRVGEPPGRREGRRRSSRRNGNRASKDTGTEKEQ